MSVRVTIVIPTFRRPLQAAQAVRSAMAQTGAPEFDIVVVDNDPLGSALEILRALSGNSPDALRVIHEPRAGVAHARNAGVREAAGEFIAFLDDDEIAPANWLAELVRVADMTGADVVFGPVRTKLETCPATHAEFYESFFAREPGLSEGVTDSVYGCGCSLVRRSALPVGAPFSIERNEIGGEDDLLFERMRASGARFAFAPGAWVWETPEPSRVTLRYTMKRAFAYGQGPAYKAWSERPPNWSRVFFWMGVGVVQTLVFAPLAAAAFLARLPRRAFLYRRAVEAVGKVLWFPLFKLRFYGASQIPHAPQTPAA